LSLSIIFYIHHYRYQYPKKSFGGEARLILPTPEGLHVESGFAAEDAGDMLAIFNVAYLGS